MATKDINRFVRETCFMISYGEVKIIIYEKKKVMKVFDCASWPGLLFLSCTLFGWRKYILKLEKKENRKKIHL